MSQSWFYGNRLTPEPELDGRRTGVVRTDDRVSPAILKGWAREMKKDICHAMEKPIVIPDNYSLAEHQAKIDTRPPARSDPGWRQGELIVVEGDLASVLVDAQGVVAAWVFPHFMKRHTLDYHNDIVAKHVEYQFPAAERAKGIIRGAKTNGQARGGADKYTTTHGVFGTATYAVAWHQQLRQNDTSFAPSKDLVDYRSVQQVVQRDWFFSSFQDIHWKINTTVALVHPRLYQCLSQLRTELAHHPSSKKILSTWGSIFPGHSLICNRTTGEHIDRNGIRRGFEAILAGGSFTGGSLYLKDIHARLQLLPGTLVLLDGTSQRHKIEAWTGEQRISNALFVHRSALVEPDIPHQLPDVTLNSIRSRLTRQPPASDVPNMSATPLSRTIDRHGNPPPLKRSSEDRKRKRHGHMRISRPPPITFERHGDHRPAKAPQPRSYCKDGSW